MYGWSMNQNQNCDVVKRSRLRANHVSDSRFEWAGTLCLFQKPDKQQAPLSLHQFFVLKCVPERHYLACRIWG